MPQTQIQLFRAADGTVPLEEWLALLEQRQPDAFRKGLERILRLERMGHELRRPAVDFLRDGIFELRWRAGTVQYRILFFYHGRNRVVLTHGFTKEGKVPNEEIERAIQCRQWILSDETRHLGAWE